jgi:prepilin-type N-terminal cleavage/methylation domain-containing protein
MNTNTPRTHRAFTIIELLVVIAIIAILAAILFPIFGTIREQARQGGTMSNMHSIYVGARMFYEDEGRFPSVLYGYAEVPVQTVVPPFAPAFETERANVLPMDQMTGTYQTTTGLHRGYLFREQIKDFQTYLNANDPARNRSESIAVFWPIKSPMGATGSIDPATGVLTGGVPVRWTQTDNSQPCPKYGDTDFPNIAGRNYLNQLKMFYRMDSMDIGPMLTRDGKQATLQNGTPVFELHYSPDWTHWLGGTCDADQNGNAYLTQLKYKNPPRERTILTYNTHHAAFGDSPYVLILLASGTARKINVKVAFDQLPLNYQ